MASPSLTTRIAVRDALGSRRIVAAVVLAILPMTSIAVVAPTEATAACARQKRVLPYPMPHVWPAAIRYLRVDRNYTVIDRDEQLGFVLFEVPLEGGRSVRGSLELVAIRDAAGRDGVQLEVAVDGGPLHLPFTLLEGIASKVKQERGQPPPPPPSAPPPRDEDPEDPNAPPLVPPAEDPPLIESRR